LRVKGETIEHIKGYSLVKFHEVVQFFTVFKGYDFSREIYKLYREHSATLNRCSVKPAKGRVNE